MSPLIKRFIFVCMRILTIIFCCALIFACSSRQKIKTHENSQLVKSKTYCPDDGVCKFEVLTNKSLSLNYDSTGQLYPEILDSKQIVVKFEYKKNEIQNTEDSSYREIIFLELDPENLTKNIKDSDLKATKALFARLCFCRGQTGYYTIKNGSLSISETTKNLYSLKFDFEISEVPQVIKSISENIQL